MRERDDEHFFPAPFTELPFDVHIVSEPLVSGMVEMASVGFLQFMAKFGWPLYVDLVYTLSQFDIIWQVLCYLFVSQSPK